MAAVNDDKTKQVFSANVNRVLAEQGHNVHWLTIATGEYPNRVYPAVRGDAMPSAGLLSRIAKALRVSIDSLLDENQAQPQATRHAKPKAKSRALANAG